MKILIFAGYYLPHTGGYIKNIHELARRMVNRGHEVTVVTCNTDNASRSNIVSGVMVLRIPSWDLLGGTYPVPKAGTGLVATIAASRSYDIIVTQTRFFPTSLLGLICSVRHGIPLVHVERGSHHSVLTNRMVSLAAKLYDHTLGTAIVRRARRSIGVSGTVCEFLEHIGAGRTGVLHNGADVPSPSTVEPGSGGVVFVGRLIHAKGVQDLIQAMGICWRDGCQLPLTIVGDGNYRYRLEQQARDSSYRGMVKFLGELSPDRVMSALAESSVFVNPSYSEGLPTSVLEAASMGLPIVATDVGGTREIVGPGAGVLVEPGDVPGMARAITVLAKDADLARALGQRARETVRRFNWDNITDQWEELLGRVVAEREVTHR